MTIQKIKGLVENRFDLILDTKSRKREIVYARCVYYKLCVDYTSKTRTDIGKELNRDHATVHHGLKIFENIKMYADPQFNIYLELKSKLDTLNLIKQKDYQPEVYYKEKYRTNLLINKDLYKFSKDLILRLKLMDNKFTIKFKTELDNIINNKQNDFNTRTGK